MTIRASFDADFTRWDAALERAKLHLKSFESTGKGVQGQLQRMFSQFDGSKVIAEAKLMAAAVEKVGGASKLTAAEMRRVNTAVTEAIAKFDALGREAPADLRKLADATRQVGTATAQAAPAAGVLGRAVGSLSSTVLAYAGPAAIGAAVIGTARWAAALDDMSAKTNLSLGVLQRMTYAAERSGVSLESATGAVQKMAQLMGDENKGFLSAVSRLGLDFAKLRSQDPGQTFLDLATSISRVQDPYERAALKQDLFGKGAKELDGFLDELASTLERDLPIASEASIRKLGELDDKIAETMVAVKVGIVGVVDAFAASNEWFERFSLTTERSVVRVKLALAEFARALPSTIAGYREQLAQLDVSILNLDANPRGGDINLGLPAGATRDPRLPAIARNTQSVEDNSKALRDAAKAAEAYARHLAALTPSSPLSFASTGFGSGLTFGALSGYGSGDAGAGLFGGYRKPLGASIVGGGPTGLFGISGTVSPMLRGLFGTGGNLLDVPEALRTPLLSRDPLAGRLFTAPTFRDTQRGPSFFQGAFGGASGFGAGLSTSILSAFQGGGSVGASAAGFIGSGLMSGLASKAVAKFGTTFLTGALGALAPGIGALLGPLAGGVIDKLFGGDAKKTKQMRADFIASAGGLDALRERADYAGVSIDRLLNTKKPKDFEKQVKALEAAFAATQKRVQALVGDLGALSESGGLISSDLIQRLMKDASKPEVQAALKTFLQQQTSTGLEALGGLAGGPILTTQAGTALAGAAGALFEQLRQMGRTTLQALREMGPTISALADTLKGLGTDGGAAFAQLLSWSSLAADQVAGPLLDSVDQVGRLLTSLTNTGWLTEEMFAGLASQVGAAFGKLVDEGKDSDTIMRLMQPTLQRLWELQERFGWTVDETTQALLDEAKAQGLVGEKFKSSQDQMIDAINKLIDRLDVFIGRILGLPDAAREAADGIRQEFDRIIPLPGGGGYYPGRPVSPDDDGGMFYARGGWVSSRNRLALGGFPFVPSGTDTVPAMLTPGEFVVSAPAARAVGAGALAAINEGRVPPAPSSVSLSVTIQAIDTQGMRKAVEEDVVPLFIDALRKSGQQRVRMRDLLAVGG